MSEAIIISGSGVLTSAGLSLSENWERMLRGESHIKPSRRWDASALRTQNFGEIYLSNQELREGLTGKLRSDRVIPYERGELLLFAALEEALKSAELDLGTLDPSRVGILVGTSLSGFTNLEDDYRNYVLKGEPIGNKSFLAYPLNVVADRIGYEYNLKGPRLLFSTACSASLHSVFWGQQLIDSGDVDVVLACGTDPLSLISMIGFSCLRSVALDACSPFSETDPGVSIGEGAAVAILEREDFRNRSKNRPIYLAGVSGNADAYHPTASDPMGTGISSCIDQSLENVETNGPCLVVSHGTGTPHNDVVETRAIKQSKKIGRENKVTGLKSVFGHTLGASGVLELVFLEKSLREGLALPTANFTTPRACCDLDYVTGEAQQYAAKHGIKNALAFGGNNMAVALSHEKPKKSSFNVDHGDAIAITGISMINGYGSLNPEEILQRIASGESGIREMSELFGFRGEGSSESVSKVDDECLERLCKENKIRNLRNLDRISRLSVLSSQSALKNSGYKVNNANASRVALISGTSSGPLGSVRDFYHMCIEKGNQYADAGLFPNTVVNAHAGHIGVQLRIKGYTTVITQGNASGLASLDLGCHLLHSGKADIALVGSTTEYSSDYHKALIDLNAISDKQSPYEFDNNGYVLGEGSTFFCLEKLSHAKRRGAHIYGVIDDVAMNSTPVLPSTYRFQRNPFFDIHHAHFDGAEPDVLLGDGIGISKPGKLEVDFAKEMFPGVPLTSTSPYFGNVPGVNLFNNIALYCVSSGSEIDIKCNDNEMLKSIYGAKSAMTLSLSEGGVAGMALLRRVGNDME